MRVAIESQQGRHGLLSVKRTQTNLALPATTPCGPGPTTAYSQLPRLVAPPLARPPAGRNPIDVVVPAGETIDSQPTSPPPPAASSEIISANDYPMPTAGCRTPTAAASNRCQRREGGALRTLNGAPRAHLGLRPGSRYFSAVLARTTTRAVGCRRLWPGSPVSWGLGHWAPCAWMRPPTS
jgi:hypothetical protein